MKKVQLRALTVFLIGFLIFNLISRRIEIPPPILGLLLIIGGIYIFKKVQVRFGSKIALYGSASFFLTFIGYIISILFLQQSPLIVAAIIMLLALLSIIFSTFSVYKLFKDKDKFIK